MAHTCEKARYVCVCVCVCVCVDVATSPLPPSHSSGQLHCYALPLLDDENILLLLIGDVDSMLPSCECLIRSERMRRMRTMVVDGCVCVCVCVSVCVCVHHVCV